MKIEIQQTISNKLDMNRNLINSSVCEVFVLYPDDGKALVDTSTGKTYFGFVTVNSKNKISDFIEKDLQN